LNNTAEVITGLTYPESLSNVEINNGDFSCESLKAANFSHPNIGQLMQASADS